MRQIKLTHGEYAIIDDEDYEKISKYKWRLTTKRLKKYAIAQISRNETPRINVLMHRFILPPENNMQIDHINRNGLDNRKSNLRFCTPKQNQGNRIATSKSGLKGIYYCNYRSGKKWLVRIAGKFRGYYKTKDEAILISNKYLSEYFGEFALLNKI